MKTGISDISIYIPSSYIDIKDIIANRDDLTPRMTKRIAASQSITDQRAIRFPSPHEDAVTLAAESGRALLVRNRERIGGIRYIGVGTESSVDASKPIASYLHGLWQRSGFKLPVHLGTFQTQHACASGTIALLSTASQLSMQDRPDESGLIICTDVARYERNSSAEITQGAGSVALLVESNPRLVELDLLSQGLASSDVDDFFRPNTSKTAMVKGQYSMKCYQDSLIQAVDDYCSRRGISAESLLEETDYFILHSPFASMPRMALRHLYEVKTGKSYEESQSLINMHSIAESCEYVGDIGNIYSGSLYFNLATTLYHQWMKIGPGIIGKKILFASYGSGNTMIVFTGTVAPGAGKVISTWQISDILSSRHHAGFPEYETWMNSSPEECSLPADDQEDIPFGRYYLHSIRSDGYRVYELKD